MRETRVIGCARASHGARPATSGANRSRCHRLTEHLGQRWGLVRERDDVWCLPGYGHDGREVSITIDVQKGLPGLRLDRAHGWEVRPFGRHPAISNADEPLWDCGPQLAQVTREHDAAVVDDDHVFAEVLDEVELVAGEQDCCAAGSELLEQFGHVADR